MVNVKELIGKFRRKQELDEELPKEEIKEEPVEGLKPIEPEEPKQEAGDSNLKMIMVKLDMLGLKLDNLDKRLQNIEELAKK